MDKTGVVEWEGQARGQQGQLVPLAGELSGEGGTLHHEHDVGVF